MGVELRWTGTGRGEAEVLGGKVPTIVTVSATDFTGAKY